MKENLVAAQSFGQAQIDGGDLNPQILLTMLFEGMLDPASADDPEARLRGLRPWVPVLEPVSPPPDALSTALFSSVSSFSGNLGQGHYAAANPYLDAFAHQRIASRHPTLSINSGLRYEARIGLAQARGFEPLATDEALSALKRSLSGPFFKYV